jgi:hypothetical protein
VSGGTRVAARRAVAAGAAIVLGTAAVGCARGGDGSAEGAAQGAAIRHLFFERERAARVVLWADPGEPGPAFEALGRAPAPPADSAALAAGVAAPVTLVRGADLRRLFRDHPDGWAAFYRSYPGAPGLVEVGPVARAPDGRTAAVVVGRACGEHCVNAWRVELRRAAGPGAGNDDTAADGAAGRDGAWRATRVTPLRVRG